MTMSWTVVLYPGEDGYIVAECPAIPGCVSQGRTEEEALENISEAISLCLEVLEEKIRESATAQQGKVCQVTV